MRTSILGALGAGVLLSGTAMAAEEWGIEHEEVARFEAKVVDILCELSGDCPDNCGGGKRQLGLLQDDGTLVLATKNQDLFAGASNDLLPFCGERIIADGLLIKDPLVTIFQLQFRRPAPDGEWRRANQFQRDWAAERGIDWESDKANAWYRHDEFVTEVLEKDGPYGIPELRPEE